MQKTEVIQYFGSLSKVAEVLGISRQAVNQWPDTVPVGRAYQIQCLTNGKLQAKKTPQ